MQKRAKPKVKRKRRSKAKKKEHQMYHHGLKEKNLKKERMVGLLQKE